MGTVIVLILSVVIIYIITAASKVSQHQKNVERLQTENKYIDSDTGQIREWPIGSYFKESERKLNNLYASKHKLEDVKSLVKQGYSISLHDDEEDIRYKEYFHSDEKPIGIYERNGIVKNLYKYDLDSVKEKGYEIFLYN